MTWPETYSFSLDDMVHFIYITDKPIRIETIVKDKRND